MEDSHFSTARQSGRRYIRSFASLLVSENACERLFFLFLDHQWNGDESDEDDAQEPVPMTEVR